MDRTESAAILESLIVGYPRVEFEDETIAYWVEAIQESGAKPDKAREVARRWARTHERFPTLAEFLAIITPPVPPYVPPDPDEMRPSPAVARQLGRLWRQALAETDAKTGHANVGRGVAGHWHGGPNPCPVCGGAPRAATARTLETP